MFNRPGLRQRKNRNPKNAQAAAAQITVTQEFTSTESIAELANSSAQDSAETETVTNPFTSVPRDIIQSIFSFLPNEDLPYSVCRMFHTNALQTISLRAKSIIHKFIENNYTITITNTKDAYLYLKYINHYQAHCVLAEDSSLDKYSKLYLLVLMTMQVMKYMNEQKLANISLLRGYRENAFMIVGGDDSPEVINIEDRTPIHDSDVSTFKTYFIHFFKDPASNYPLDAIQATIELQLFQLKQSVQPIESSLTEAFLKHFVFFCSAETNTQSIDFSSLVTSCLNGISRQIDSIKSTQHAAHQLA